MSRLISDKYKEWEELCRQRFQRLKANEEQLNRYYIDLYGMGSEITPEVDDTDVTVRLADLQREIRSLISYAVGCIFGRYSLDREGLCYAGGKWDSSVYSTIIPCKDNIMTLNSPDSGLTRAVTDFVEKVYGSETLVENLRFIADALGGSGEPVTVIHNYLRKDFFADHFKVYKKRPIYWQFTSGKKSVFTAFMYFHRYTPELIEALERKYAVPCHEKLKNQLSSSIKLHKSSTGAEKSVHRRDISRLQAQITEMEGFIARLRLLAEQKIVLEADDGIRANYEKLNGILV
jgi:hypothetical protein